MERREYSMIATLLVLFLLAGCSGGEKRPFMESSADDTLPEAVSANPDTAAIVPLSSAAAGPSGRVVGSGNVTATASAVVSAPGVTLLIDSGAVGSDVEITVIAATEEQTGVIPASLTNLTAGGGVYRMLPDGQQFRRDITIAMSYDSTALPYGCTAGVVATRRGYSYGAYGNVVHVDDYGDVNDLSDDYSVSISYDIVPSLYIVDNVSELNIPGYRNRKAYYDSYGSLAKLTVYNNPSPASDYLYSYDSYGNVATVTTPATQAGSSGNYWIQYTYDALTNSLPVIVTNAEGHTSYAKYSLRWQKPTSTTDIGGNIMRYHYDCHGRPDTVIAPKELENNLPYTVRYDYWYNHKYDTEVQGSSYNHVTGRLSYSWARTFNYDPANPSNDIGTVTFSDGLGRIIQVKKEIDENGVEKRAVGGTVHYDGLGRKVREFFPVSEPLVNDDTVLYNTVSAYYSETLYDWLDRPVRVDYADGTYTSNAYSISPDDNSINRLRIDATDQNGHTSYTYTDPRQLTVQFTDALGGTTMFQYDAVGQLTTTTDPEHNVTTHTYDLGGRRTDRDHPSAGHTQWDYDAAGNVVMQTQNSGEQIFYEYDYSRLIHVGYSVRTWNDVWFEYGAANTGNKSGRLVRQQDASGVQEFVYDNMGNIIYNAHTFVQPHSTKTLTLDTRWEYDSWGRVLNITYPDREVVDYLYDHGGNVRRIEGAKPGQNPTLYVDIIHYDCFGQRTYQKDGNGVETSYQYEPDSRRLGQLTDNSTLTNQTLQDLGFKYDNVGNITSIDDGGLYDRSQTFEYDDINRLVYSDGSWNNGALSYRATYTYSAAGRMLGKDVTSLRRSTSAGTYAVNYQNSYSYPSAGNPFAPSTVRDDITGHTCGLEWDANGNLHSSSLVGQDSERRLCWTEDSRLQGYVEYSAEEGNIAAYYNYAADGERNFKFTSPRVSVNVNAVELMQTPPLVYPTLYASALLTLNKGGYTKHYFEGENRICSKIGGGFGTIGDWDSISRQLTPVTNVIYDTLTARQNIGLKNTFYNCFNVEVGTSGAYDLRTVLDENEQGRNDHEEAFFYHSDHLGSAAYITNELGHVTQTLNYLPYGEDWVDEQNYTETRYPRLGIYTFNGKEKDYESGFHYYGARYYWSELLTGWLSVDPMMDKYPSISPYAYCAWNPVKLVDPDGDSIAVLIAEKAVFGYGHMAILIKNKKKWELWSKNGEGKSSSGNKSGSKNDMPYKYIFSSIQEFLDKPIANSNEHSGEDAPYYTEAYMIPTTEKQDEIIRNNMESFMSSYHLLSDNCADAVKKSLNAAGIETEKDYLQGLGNFAKASLALSPEYQRSKHLNEDVIPVTMYNNIKDANPNGRVYKPQSKWWNGFLKKISIKK